MDNFDKIYKLSRLHSIERKLLVLVFVRVLLTVNQLGHLACDITSEILVLSYCVSPHYIEVSLWSLM